MKVSELANLRSAQLGWAWDDDGFLGLDLRDIPVEHREAMAVGFREFFNACLIKAVKTGTAWGVPLKFDMDAKMDTDDGLEPVED